MVNKRIYEYFQQMLDNYNVSDVLFETGVTYLFSLKPENPYEPGSEENRLFDKLLNLCFTWQKGGVDSKVSFKRMIAFAKQFCELVNENPFVYVLAVEEQIVEESAVKEEAQTVEEPNNVVVEETKEEQVGFDVPEVIESPELVKKIVNENADTVLGVVPEEKKSLFKRNKKKKEGA